MADGSNDAWLQMWEERGREYPNDDLALVAGYDQPYSRLSSSAIEDITATITLRLQLGAGDRLLEVGAGSGLFLGPLSQEVYRASGVDYAPSMLHRAKNHFPHLDLAGAEAAYLPFVDAAFNKVLMHGVVFYFPDESYLTSSLDEILRVCQRPGLVLVCDVLDSELRENHLKARADSMIGSSVVAWRSSVTKELTHLYTTRGFFSTYASEHQALCKTFARDIEGYVNGDYRFDVLLTLL